MLYLQFLTISLYFTEQHSLITTNDGIDFET